MTPSSLCSHPSSLCSHPSSLCSHPSSLIPHPSSLIPHPSSPLFLFIIWSKARKFEDEIRADLARHFKIVHECEITWPRWDFTRRLWDFYGFGTRFMWWNKGRKCGRGPFKVIVVEDENAVWSHQRDTRGQDLQVDENVYREKKELRRLTRHSNIIHASVTPEETRSQLEALDLDYLIPHPSSLEQRLDRGELKFLGSGSRRECYEIPGTGLCLKCYRKAEDVTDATVRREIIRYAHDEKRSTCCQEYRYYRELKRTLPPYVFEAFPDEMRQIHLPKRGWAVVESQICNTDGSECVRFSETYRTASKVMQQKLLQEFWLLMGSFSAYAVRFYDTQNIVVQMTANGFRLRVVDFEPASRTLFPIDKVCPAIARGKVLRRAKRYLGYHLSLKSCYRGLTPSVRRKWDSLITAEGAKMGLMGCRVFLENKILNDIFYRGKFSGKSCVVKCTSISAESLEREAEMLRGLYARDHVHFPEVLAFRSLGHKAILVMEDVGSASLMDLFMHGEIDSVAANRFATDIIAIAHELSSMKIVHRDIGPANLLINADGHLKLIDFQLAVSANDYRETKWAMRHPTYLYVAFGSNRDLPLGCWNDVSSLIGILHCFPQTPEVKDALRNLEASEAQGQLSHPPRALASLRLGIHASSLRLQRFFARGEKSRKISQRLDRFRKEAR